MDEIRKRAYRYLLYRAMLDIRPLAWTKFDMTILLNPIRIREIISRVRIAGEIAYWLHNLAFYSAHEFEGFVESRFWGEFELLKRRYSGHDISIYAQTFNGILAGNNSAFGHDKELTTV